MAMFSVTITTLGDSSIIVLKSAKPYVQMSYQYDGDLSALSDEDATSKVLDSFYNEVYKDKVQESKITELELNQLKQQQDIDDIKKDVTKLKGGNSA
jgi:Ran GTPase-activating protein (RanGAP) involved in mRNA processing and transport